MLYKGPAVRLLPALAWMSRSGVQATPVFFGGDFGQDTTIQCSDVGDPTQDPGVRWNKALCDEAFTNASKAAAYQAPRISLPVAPPGGGAILPFDEAVSHFFNGPENLDCSLGNTVCSAGVGDCHSVTSPAGWLILNSFTNFHNYFQNLFDGIGDAQGDVQGQIQSFANLFAPPVANSPKDMTGLFLTIFSAVISIALSFVSAGAALGAFGALGTVAGLDAAKLTDKGASVVSTLSAQAFNLAKENLPAAEQAIENAGALSDKVVAVVDQMQGTISTMVKSYSNDGAAGDAFTSFTTQGLFSNGTWVNAPLGKDSYDYKQNFKNILFGSLINTTFSLTPNLRPALAWETKDCNDHSNEPFGSFKTARSCAIPGKVAWLLSMDMNNYQVGFQPGVASDQLTGNPAIWGGILFDDLVTSIYEGWTAAGSPASGLYNIDSHNLFADGSGNKAAIPWVKGTKTPGFFQLPTCTMRTFYINTLFAQAKVASTHQNFSPWAGFPCGSPPS